MRVKRLGKWISNAPRAKPATIASAPNGRFSRQPLPGNIIPQSRVDAVGAKIASFYPLPNQPGQNAEETNNFFNTQKINRENYIHTSRVDHNFSQKNRFFFRWFNQQHDNSTDFLGTITNVDLLDRTAWGVVADVKLIDGDEQYFVGPRFSF